MTSHRAGTYSVADEAQRAYRSGPARCSNARAAHLAVRALGCADSDRLDLREVALPAVTAIRARRCPGSSH
jgi:hypothetical protein